MSTNNLPKLITFDGEARSGKGTIVQATKDYLRDHEGCKVMLIDAGQVFRVLVVAAVHAGIDVNNPEQIDVFLGDESEAEKCVQLVKDVYHMDKSERDALLYTNEVGANSAKIGARPLSQEFKDMLLKKWLHDAREDGYEVVLLDGRALEETGTMLASEKLCEFVMGLYFVCDAVVGARRTLGFAGIQYEKLDEDDRSAVDELVEQINARNFSDSQRKVQPIVPPLSAPTYKLPEAPAHIPSSDGPIMMIFDTSADIAKDKMTLPVESLVSEVISSSRPFGNQTTAS